MLQTVEDYHYPGSLDEALSLKGRESRSFFIAGGTALALSDSSRPVELIDVSRLGLDGIELDEDRKELTIGATTRIQSVVESEEAGSVLGGFLSESLEEIGSYPIRNAGTLGGSLVRPFPWSDVLPILSVLEATVRYYHDGESKNRDFSRLYESDFRSELSDSIIEEIVLEIPEEGRSAASFHKFNRSEFDVAALNLACLVTSKGGKVTDARLAVGARPMRAERASKAEEVLIGEELGREAAEEAARVAAETVDLNDDRKLSGEYREALVEKMTAEAMDEISKEVLR